jgi:spoIIIJ-associated protein
VSYDPQLVEIEAAGETIGEAKWQAVRELERLHPGLDRDAVTFEVLTEGERGLLGVGTSPARVLARLNVAASPPMAELDTSRAATAGAATGGSPLAQLVQELVERIADELGVPARVAVAEDDELVRASASGQELGFLIGRDGRTIDAVQYIVSAIAHRAQGEGGKSVEVDAGGYRERRRARLIASAQRAADRALATGRSVALEAMTPAERRIVHTALQDLGGVETSSEGDEPNRYVVVLPAAALPPKDD